jgi:hypothetical protein
MKHKAATRQIAAFLLFTSILVGCTDVDNSKEPIRKARKAQQEQAVQAALNAGPQTRSWQTPEGAVIEVTIPKTSGPGRLLESQRCIVWRDAVTNTSALHCDREEIDMRNFEGDPPEIER